MFKTLTIILISRFKKKFKLKNIFIILKVLILTIILLELLLRFVFGNCGVGELFDLNDYSNGYVKLSPNKNIMHTGLFEKIPRVEQKTNSFGYRGLNRSPEKNKNTFRIIIVGDSFTFCPGLKEGKDYPSMLEYFFKKKMEDVEVLNFGVPSHNLVDLKLHLLDEGVKFNPDMVILQIAQNDFSPSMYKIFSSKDQLVKYLFSLSHISYVGRFLFGFYLIKSESYSASYKKLWGDFNKILDDIIEKTKELNINLVVTSFGDPFRNTKFSIENYLLDKKINYIPFPVKLKSYLSFDCHHLSEKGAEQYAYILSEKMHKVIKSHPTYIKHHPLVKKVN